MSAPIPIYGEDPYSFLTLDNLVIEPPVTANSVRNFHPEIIAQDAANTRIIIHPRFPSLVQSFLAHKRQHGSQYEKDLYRTDADWTWRDQVSRLIAKRPLVFMGSSDFTVLRGGEHIAQPREQWDRNGTAEQHLNADLTLAEYLSYDEMMLSSLVGVSGPSHFINTGARENCGQPQAAAAAAAVEPRGIIVGLVGARFERPDRMDSVFILPPAPRPRQHPDLTRLFFSFFRVEPDAEPRTHAPLFDVVAYKARMRVTADLLLHEAAARAAAAAAEQKAHVYIVGLGLGVWARHGTQPNQFVDAFADALDALPAGAAARLATLEFAYVRVSQQYRRTIELVAEPRGVRVVFSQRDPAAKLGGADRGNLLVLSYAWDGNAFPGNEYWVGSLMGSGDPAAACMSTVGELHNPLVNPGFLERVVVVGEGEEGGAVGG